jgi:hypothetical protein
MTRTYTTYGMTLISAAIVFWTFGLFSSAAAGYSWVPFSSFLASILHFGLSSWLILYLQKVGRIIAVLTGITMCIWPVMAVEGTLNGGDIFMTLIFVLPVILTVFVIYNHVLTFSRADRPTLKQKLWLTLLPAGLFIAYMIHILTMIKTGRISFG